MAPALELMVSDATDSLLPLCGSRCLRSRVTTLEIVASVNLTVHPKTTIMIRASTTPFVLSIGLWCSLLAIQTVAAQSSAVGSIAPVRISELGLDDELVSAIDLVGPGSTSAGALRDRLIDRLQCWIDGVDGCVEADVNDPRVRAFRRHLSFGTYPQDGGVTVLFPDGSRIELGIGRKQGKDLVSWDERAYATTVLVDTARAPGVPFVPTQLSALERLSYDVSPEVHSALERLRTRLQASVDSSRVSPAAPGNQNRPALAQGQL